MSAMKKSDVYRIIGCLIEAENYTLANEVVIMAAKNFPALNAPPANISKKALILWTTHVWPKYKATIKKAGDKSEQWRAAMGILKRSAEKRGIPVFTWDKIMTIDEWTSSDGIHWIKADASNLKGFVTDIEKDTKENTDFRRVLYTGKTSQLVLMSLKPGEDIGEEVHDKVDQFFRIDDGEGKVIINGTESPIKNGSAFVIPQGAKHNVIAGDKGLKLYSIYSPPNHKEGTIHKTKEEATKAEEKFDGKTTEVTGASVTDEKRDKVHRYLNFLWEAQERMKNASTPEAKKTYLEKIKRWKERIRKLRVAQK